MAVPQLRDLTLDQLREYDGTGPSGKIYLAVQGVVFDVSAGGADYYAQGQRDVKQILLASCLHTPSFIELTSEGLRRWLSCDGWTRGCQGAGMHVTEARGLHTRSDRVDRIPAEDLKAVGREI